MTQKEFLSNLLENNKDAFIIGSLGTISSDLIATSSTRIVPIKGAMGCAMSIGLGCALGNPAQDYIVVIGDGSFLMKMGSIATIRKHHPRNLRVIILNNGKLQSTGGQPTNFDMVKDFIPGYFEVVNL